MHGSIKNIIPQLLACTDAGHGKPLVDALVRELCRVTGLDLHPEFFLDEHATITAQGKAVSPVTAAQCAEDVERTRVFLQGVNAAIQDKILQQSHDRPVQILYAGTGPFGLLLVPLLPFFTVGSVQVTLLDIHAESLEKLQRVLAHLEVGHCVCHIEQVDVCEWQSAEFFDVIISETMRQGLIQEPQVKVFAHLRQFLAEEGLLIPEIIRLDLWLARAGVAPTTAHSAQVDVIHLGKLFQLDKITAAQLGAGDDSVLQGNLLVPDYPPRLCDLKLTTFIQVYQGYQLHDNQSQLTLPLYEKNASPIPGKELQYCYVMGSYPRCIFTYDRIIGQDANSLPDSMDPNQQGVYHLKRLWHKIQYQKTTTSAARERLGAIAEDEWLLDRVLIDSLGLGLEPAMEQLYQSKNLAEFETWVGAANKEAFTSEIIDKVNNNLLRFLRTKNAAEVPSNAPLTTEQLAFWETHGYLVVPGALNLHQCTEAREAIWNFLGMKEGDPETWYRSSADMKKIMVQLFDHPALDVARNSEYIRQIFEQLWRRDDLVMITDRVSFNPPETQEWKFPGPGIHWDVELKAPVPFATQALIYFNDVAENQGAFCCVPGFHKKIDQWLGDLPEEIDPAEQDWSQWPVKPIAAKAGDLIIWHQALPHGSSPNRANYPRIVQYINMYR